MPKNRSAPWAFSALHIDLTHAPEPVAEAWSAYDDALTKYAAARAAHVAAFDAISAARTADAEAVRLAVLGGDPMPAPTVADAEARHRQAEAVLTVWADRCDELERGFLAAAEQHRRAWAVNCDKAARTAAAAARKAADKTVTALRDAARDRALRGWLLGDRPLRPTPPKAEPDAEGLAALERLCADAVPGPLPDDPVEVARRAAAAEAAQRKHAEAKIAERQTERSWA